MDLPSGPARDFSFAISDGAQGVRETLAIMRRIVRQYKRDPGMVTLARQCTNGLRGKDWDGEIACLFDFVREHIRYVQDPVDVESLTTPDRLLEIGSGDCDDMATLLAVLLEAIGHPTRFKAVGFSPGDLSHVYVQTEVGNHWESLDPTENYPIGWEPGQLGTDKPRNVYLMHNR